MRLISADFNAMTEAGHVRLTLPCSREDILRMSLGPGDWAWLSDSEILVGAQLAIDDRYGLVGVPDWDTLVHLDEEGADDFNRVSAALNLLLNGEPPSIEEEPRILELLTQSGARRAAADQRRLSGDFRLPACSRPAPDGQAGPGALGDRGRSTLPA